MVSLRNVKTNGNFIVLIMSPGNKVDGRKGKVRSNVNKKGVCCFVE